MKKILGISLTLMMVFALAAGCTPAPAATAAPATEATEVPAAPAATEARSEEHTSELQSH